MRKRICAALASGVLIGALTAAAMSPVLAVSASAEENYNCPEHGYCQNINGRNEEIDYNEGCNYEEPECQPGTCSTIWKYNGGSNYNAVAHECNGIGKSTACSGHVDGHGQVTAITGGGYLAGHQDNKYHTC